MKLKTIILLLLACSCMASETYTVIVGSPELIRFTNVITDPWMHESNCYLIRYVENGRTNEFHAWMQTLLIFTNKPAITIKWQYDDIRTILKKDKDSEEAAEQFNKTNTDPHRVTSVIWSGVAWTPRKGDIELGYRSDGVVVWRPLPEVEEKP